MATSRHRLDRAELKRPDDFVVGLEKLWRAITENLSRAIIAAVVLIALVAIGFGVRLYYQHREQMAASGFYDAITLLNHKDYKKAAAGFSALVDERAGRLSELSRVYLASALIAQKHYAQARDTLLPYVDSGGGDSIFRGFALNQLGAAYEDLGDFSQAHAVYVRAAALSGPESDSAQIAAARTLAEAGDQPGAISAYRKFIADNPLAPQRGDVIAALAALGAAPSATPPVKAAPIAQTTAPKASAAVPVRAALAKPAAPGGAVGNPAPMK